MALQLHVTVDGERVIVEVPSAGYRNEVANALVGVGPAFETPGPPECRLTGRILAVGQHLSELGNELASSPTAGEVVAFGDTRLDAGLAGAFLWFELAHAAQELYPGWKSLRIANLSIDLAYPAWPGLPVEDRTQFLGLVASNGRRPELTVNGRLAVRQSRARRMLGRGPVVDADA